MPEKSSDPSFETNGIVYLVGAGPGDPGLMTLRGKECIELADVILYDYLSNADFLKWAKPGAEKIYVGKKAKNHALPQGGINELLVEKAKAGNIVTRLKGGDPLVFGRGGEEAQELRAAGVAFEIVPGISSSIAGPAYAGIPVTHRAHNAQLTIFTGHEDPTKAESSIDYEQIAKAPGTKVMLMGVERLRIITDQLQEHGLDAETPVALVRWATTGNQETVTGTVATIADVVEKTGFKAPAVCVIGGVVGLRDELNWFENRPLFGKRVVVTRTRTQIGGVSRQLRDLGADVLEIPTIKIGPSVGDDLKGFAEMVQGAHTYDWLIFTSPNGVDYFFEMFFKLFDDIRAIGGARIASIGPGTTAKLKEHGLTVDLVPEKSVAEGLADAFEKEIGSLENLTMFWARAEGARDVLSQRLNDAGVMLDEGIAYRTVPETADPTGAVARFEEEGADIITFTSSSTVDCFFDMGLELPEGIQIASIGPITSDTIRNRGLNVDIEAEVHNIPGLVDAVRKLAGAD